MKVAVIGGTGLVGRDVVRALAQTEHEVVVVARSEGVDVRTGAGLAGAVAGADAVVDVLNLPASDADDARALFGAATKRLLAAEQQAGVRHHVLLSILALDRFEGPPHCAGKRLQEELVLSGPIPATVLRAAQFHDFAGMVVRWLRSGDEAHVPPLLLQPVATADVGLVLAQLAAGKPQAGAIDLAGPEPQDLIDMARRTLAARGETVRLVPTWRAPFGVEMAGEVLLPDTGAQLTTMTFDAWLATQGPDGRASTRFEVRRDGSGRRRGLLHEHLAQRRLAELPHGRLRDLVDKLEGVR